ncbi:MAG: hypothetical protein M2R45_00341 [Verrucomicrobia subdivision 3 bacterium]|nr:hypothetical protein [Limisphaerales bacterium]MCS1412901.1 hypothetical protein [Limisphaerales bacterium]
MLSLRPELVGNCQSIPDVPQDASFPSAKRGTTMKDVTQDGHGGFPSAASRAKGETLIQCFSERDSPPCLALPAGGRPLSETLAAPRCSRNQSP